MNKLLPLLLFPALLLPPLAGAQSSCDSDGQPAPVSILERFISADCEACWGDAKTVQPAAGELVLDWIVPGKKGEDAPLSAAASRDAPLRLQALKRATPATTANASHKIAGARGRTVRVAHGLPFNGYVGASIETMPATGGPWTAWLLVVQTIPAGSEGTPVERRLVRNALSAAWSPPAPGQPPQRMFESRPMSLPEGIPVSQLGVVGWVQDARGHIVAAAQSRCAVLLGAGS